MKHWANSFLQNANSIDAGQTAPKEQSDLIYSGLLSKFCPIDIVRGHCGICCIARKLK